MPELLTVKFGLKRITGNFLSDSIPFRVGDRCVVASERGLELGMVLDIQKPRTKKTEHTLGNVLRQATERDLYLYEKKKQQEEIAYQLCRKKIKAYKLPMKLAQVEYIFDGSRVIIYFTASQRVDFRKLVKQLARQLRIRVEMRQIGARDEAKIVGGLGCCGMGQNCSSLFLKEVKSVSVRTVKQQDLGMSMNRLSGMCGRLKCCLNFEVEIPRKKCQQRSNPAVN